MSDKITEEKYELVFCIVNAGYSDEVMEAAKEAGAKGGTVIHARGTAGPGAEKKFNITIHPDKDAVLMVVPEKIKDKVLHAVYNKVGMGTAGNGIAFSSSINDVVGIKKS